MHVLGRRDYLAHAFVWQPVFTAAWHFQQGRGRVCVKRAEELWLIRQIRCRVARLYTAWCQSFAGGWAAHAVAMLLLASALKSEEGMDEKLID
jgi:hypothetical protein